MCQTLSFCFLYASFYVESLLSHLISSLPQDHGEVQLNPQFLQHKHKGSQLVCGRARIWIQPVCFSCISSYCPSLSESEAVIQSEERRGSNQRRGGEKETNSAWGPVSIWLFLSSLRGESALSISSWCGWWTGWTISMAAWSPSCSPKKLCPYSRNLRNNLQLCGEWDRSSFFLGSILAVERQKSKWQKQTPNC